uniref:Uncharacterized protein n=1 Tax=Plectus sambesii TaxID=2011161 RepID=A0A914VQC6_9BILA
MLPTTSTALLLLVAHLCSRATAAPTTSNILKVVVLNTKPFSFLDVENAISDDDAQYTGILIDLFKQIAGRLNISYEFHEVTDGKYGYQDEKGEWQGLIGELVSGKADIAVAPLTITAERSKVVRFGRPIIPAGIVPIIKRPPSGQPLPFSTIDELVANTDLLYGAVKDGATHQFFSNAPNSSVSAFIGQQMNERTDEVLARSYDEGIKRVREGGYVFFGEQYSLELLASRAPCNLMVVGGNPITPRHYALGFRKDAVELADQFDQLLIELEWDVNKIMNKYWEPQCAKPRICMCEKRSRDAFTKHTTESGSKEDVKSQQEENDDESKEEEDRKEDRTGNEEKTVVTTEQEQKVAEAVPEVKNDEAESAAETTTVASEQSVNQDQSTQPPAVPEGGIEGEGQGASDSIDDIITADMKNETNSEL